MEKKNIPHPGLTRKDVEKLLKESKKVLSFGGEKYIAMHKSVVAEILENHRIQAELKAKDHTIIGSSMVRTRKKSKNS